jgi:hypothetical protein
MFECVRELGISEWLVWKVEEIYVRTKSKEKEGGEWFESTKGVTQAARLPPCYLLYMADMDEMLKKAQAGGGECGRERESLEPGVCEWLGKSEKEFKEMMKSPETYSMWGRKSEKRMLRRQKWWWMSGNGKEEK